MKKYVYVLSLSIVAAVLLMQCSPSKEEARKKQIEDSLMSKQMFSNVSTQIQANIDSENGVKLTPVQRGFRRDSIKWSNAMGMPLATKRLALDSAKDLLHAMSAGQTNQIYFIDFTADHYMGTVINGNGLCDSVEWHFTYFGGLQVMQNSIRYLSIDGENYQARVVVKPSTDSTKEYDAYFESKRFQDATYQKGTITVLDAHMTPWVVNVDYPKSAGMLVFIVSPYTKK